MKINLQEKFVMNNNKDFLGTEPISKLLLKLSIPTVIAQLVNMLYNVIDRIYIGHMPNGGSLALTGIGVCMPLIMLISAFAALVSSGGAPRASIFMGQKDMVRAEKTLGNCFSIQIVISIILTFVLLIWGKDFLFAFGASEKTIEYSTGYMNIYALGTIFVQMTLGMNAFITAQGFTKISMVSVIIGAVSNILLDPLFIFVFKMGVRGAALATVISQMISCIWIISFLCGKKAIIRIKKKYLKLQSDIISPCISLGTAAFVMQASESVISVCFNSSLLSYGGDIAVGTMTIMVSIMQFAMLPLQGIAQGAQPIISYNYGAKNANRVKKTFQLLLATCLIYSVTLWAAVMLAPHYFVKIFTADKQLIEFASPMLRIYLGGLGLFGIQIACQMTFTSLGKAVNSIIVAIVRKFVLLLPLIYIMPNILSDKTKAVYSAEPVADIIAVTFTALLFVFQFRKILKSINTIKTEG